MKEEPKHLQEIYTRIPKCSFQELLLLNAQLGDMLYEILQRNLADNAQKEKPH